MNRFLIVVLALYGGYYYASKRYEFHDTLIYAQKHPNKAWSGPVQYYIGLAYYQRTDYPKAQEAFTKLLELDPTGYYTPKVLIHLDDVAQYNRDWDTAKAALSRYIEEYPAGKKIELAKQRLDMLRYRHP